MLSDSRSSLEEALVRRIVGPQREHPARVQLQGQLLKPGPLVKGRVAGMQQVPRRVIDVQKHRVEFPPRLLRIEAPLRIRGPREEI